MAKATQFCVALENQPGMLAKLCGVLKRAKVNIEAISVADNVDCAWVRIVASPANAAADALKKAGYNVCKQRVLTVKTVNKPGEMEAIATKLAKAKVNINYVYGTGAACKDPECDCSVLVFGVSDVDAAEKAL
ncbi:MAG: hypothetical protein HRF45_08830 [Fimbriimonadia bacterium]|jgi:hypothetical protein